MKKIQFGYIAPMCYLDLIPENATFHLVLTHYLKDPTYLAFYKKKQERGDVIIADNMAFELKKSIPSAELIETIDKSGLQPTYVVAPDYPSQDWKVTWDSTLEFIEQVKGKPYKVMAVPQSTPGDVGGWLKGYLKMLEHPEIAVIGMSILGIPNAFKWKTGTDDISFNRLYATQYLLQNKLVVPGQKHHHYLGLGSGPRELILQRQLGLIDTNDSSSPIWHGHLGIAYDFSQSGLINGKTPIEVDFNCNTTDIRREFIEFNIEYMERVVLQ